MPDGHDDKHLEIGLEDTPEAYVARLVDVFREVRRVLRDDGTLWLNLGDSYASNGCYINAWMEKEHNKGKKNLHTDNHTRYEDRKAFRGGEWNIKAKDLVGIPWRVAFALQADGWWLRQDIIWHKINPMPESVTDRCTKAHEYVFLLAKGQWKSRVVECANLGGKRGHFVNDAGLDDADMRANKIAVGLATAVLDCTKGENNVALSALDAKERAQGSTGGDGDHVGRLPVIHSCSSIATRFLKAECSAEEFLGKLHGFGLALSDGNKLLIGGGAAILPLPPSVNAYGNASVAVHDAGQICEFDLFHGRIIHRWPSGCQYYYDAEAVKEPATYLETKARVQFSSRRAKANGRIPSGNEAGKEYLRPETRNLRDVWTVATKPFKEAHFATFPPDLIRPCILAGTSERGCCPKCGAPWVRCVERAGIEASRDTEPCKKARGVGREGNGRDRALPGGYTAEHRTTGWRPGCECGGEPVPCVVLDPFFGAGTTGLVAKQEGRGYVGIELNPEYVDMARRRIADVVAEPALC